MFFTKKADALYAITTGWLAPQITIKNIKVPAGAKVTLLGVPGELKYKIEGKDLVVDVWPVLMPQDLPCLYGYTLKISGGELLPE